MENPATRSLHPDCAFDASAVAFGDPDPVSPMTKVASGRSCRAESPSALLLASTPLHSFWALGLACGPLKHLDCSLALIDQADEARDFVAEAVEHLGHPVFSRIERFPRIGKRPLDKLQGARKVMRAVSTLSAGLRPDYILVGNDRRAEFHAALRAAPGAVGGYMDDGMFSYRPMRATPRSRAGSWVGDRFRHLVYGVPAEQPDSVGASAAVSEAWVMLPQSVHAGLASKKLHAMSPKWFRDPQLQSVCREAVTRAGLEAAAVQRIQLLLVLPHESLLRSHPELLQRISTLAHAAARQGRCVAFKRHPKSSSRAIGFLPTDSIEIPRRLPVELLAPLLSGCTVVGGMTSALLSLRCLGTEIDVRFLPGQGAAAEASTQVFLAAGVKPLDA